MPGRRARGGARVQPPSLFPFLSVLVCLVGVLMFLAAAVALTSLESASANVSLQISWKNGEQSKQPLYLECIEGACRDLASGVRYTAAAEENASRSFFGTPFTSLLGELGAARSQEYILFIVRPSGLDSFRTLRSLLVRRNRERFVSRVRVREPPNAERLKSLPPQLAKRLDYQDGELIYQRVMSQAELEAVRLLFASPSDQRAVEELHTKSQDKTGWVDYGTELVPEGWSLDTKEQEQTP